jgi:hypothetical protein
LVEEETFCLDDDDDACKVGSCGREDDDDNEEEEEDGTGGFTKASRGDRPLLLLLIGECVVVAVLGLLQPCTVTTNTDKRTTKTKPP